MSDVVNQLSVLILDDEKNIRETIKLVLEQDGIQAAVAHDIAAAMRVLGERTIDILILDICLDTLDGVSLFKKLQAEGKAPATIFISGHATLSQAAEAVRAGAFDFLEKPFSAEKIVATVRRCAEHSLLQRRLTQLEKQNHITEIIGDSTVMKQLIADSLKVAVTDASVMIQGESGTGKELVANTIHRNSPRATGPFVRVNCSAIPETLIESELFGYDKGAFSGAINSRKGLFEQAHHGTIFLDEIADLSLSAQAKVLRVLQSGEIQKLGSHQTLKVNVRVVSATHKNLKQNVIDGLFREDLYYRLNVIPVKVPSLRDRPGDIPLLVHFISRALSEKNNLKAKVVDEEVIAEFQRYDWPGNVRELQNVLERMLIMSGDHITLDHVPDDILIPDDKSPRQTAGLTLRTFRNSAEREYILSALKRNDGNVTRAAAELGVGRTYLHRRLVSFGITKSEIY